ncbi:Hemin uptake protein HemP [Salinihabitans flavidus]|uniref:Hemin uptake protein HemP n=2 Tax=Salinihabitans flavidus TaxID=569882 RepID=A0A1H8MU86_9RHOB|nr:Hemin uptake protein HemP [Salinihabitans flavidus]
MRRKISLPPKEGTTQMNAQTHGFALQNDLPVYDATQLTSPTGLARIVLGDQVYTLRITRAGKLILTK